MDFEEKTRTRAGFIQQIFSKGKILPPQKSTAKPAVTSVFSSSCCLGEGHTCSPLWKSCSSLNSCHPSWALGEGNEFSSGSHFISRIIKQFSVQSHSCNTLLPFFFNIFFLFFSFFPLFYSFFQILFSFSCWCSGFLGITRYHFTKLMLCTQRVILSFRISTTHSDLWKNLAKLEDSAGVYRVITLV